MCGNGIFGWRTCVVARLKRLAAGGAIDDGFGISRSHDGSGGCSRRIGCGDVAGEGCPSDVHRS